MDQHADNPPLLCIGGGTMASALVLSALDADATHPSSVVVVDPDPDTHAKFSSVGVRCYADLDDAMQLAIAMENETAPSMAMLAVKPQQLNAVAHSFDTDTGRAFLGQPRTVLSILAGCTSTTIEQAFTKVVTSSTVRVIRVMPNTPAQIGCGIAAMHMCDDVPASDATFARTLITSSSDSINLDESMFDAFTAVAGSGPAYLFYLAEAMERGAIDVGFDHATAKKLVDATIRGSAQLLHASASTAHELRTQVTSKNGTTQAATDTLDKHRVMKAVVEAIRAARDRGLELGKM